MNKRTGPYKTVKSGNVLIPIYRNTNVKDGQTYTEFKVAFYQHEGSEKKRRMKTFSDCAKAERFAENLNAAINKGDAHTLVLTGDEFHAYQDAMNTLSATGKPLALVAHEYANAMKRLNGTPLAVAVDGYLRAFAKMQKKNVQAVVDELVEFKRSNKRRPASEVYIDDMRRRLDKFAESFNMDIDEISVANIEDFLANVKGSGRTQFNCGRLIRTLFNFAETRHYLPKDSNPFDEIDLTFEDNAKIEIFTPGEMRKLMDAARPEMIPFLALAGFAGMRNAEVRRLDWSDIGADEIKIEKAKSKTRQNRIIAIQPNLAKWLSAHRKKSGPVVEFVHVCQQLDLLAKDAKVEWKHNALRHSFVSYSFALHGARQTSNEAGHSETMLFQNYRSLVNADAAREWFSIVPPIAPR